MDTLLLTNQMVALISTNQRATSSGKNVIVYVSFFVSYAQGNSSQQSNSTRNSTTPISPIAMKRDGNSRANNDENVAVESLSIIEKTSVCSCMKSRYKIDIILIY